MLCGCVGLSEHVEDYSVGCGKCLPIYNWLVTGHPSLSLPFPKLGNWESLLSFPFSSPHPQGPQGPLIAVQGVLPWSPSSPTQPPSSQPEAMGAGGIPQSQLQKMEQRNQSRPFLSVPKRSILSSSFLAHLAFVFKNSGREGIRRKSLALWETSANILLRQLGEHQPQRSLLYTSCFN